MTSTLPLLHARKPPSSEVSNNCAKISGIFSAGLDELKCRQTQIGIQTQIRTVPKFAYKSQNIENLFRFKTRASLNLSNFPKSF